MTARLAVALPMIVASLGVIAWALRHRHDDERPSNVVDLYRRSA